jgi:hypothetical protein
MAQPEVAASLSHDAVAEPLEGTDGFPSRDDGKPGSHRVTTLPTRTLEGSGMSSPWACMSSRHSSMASRMGNRSGRSDANGLARGDARECGQE